MEAGTTNGRVYSDYPITVQGGELGKKRIVGRIGEGGKKLHLSTTNGNIDILRGPTGPAEQPPPPPAEAPRKV